MLIYPKHIFAAFTWVPPVRPGQLALMPRGREFCSS